MSAVAEGPIAIALHGGCGVLARDDLTETEWAEARADIETALRAGWAVLREGGGALDAVEACVVVLENSPHFNAGYGAALNRLGEHELDAAIMDGANGAAGAVCGVRTIRNRVRAARAVLEKADAVLLAGAAADRFAAEAGLEMVLPSHFTTLRRIASRATMQARRLSGGAAEATEAERHGTVGAVALDRTGHLAAATSTGGYTDKPAGRIGDTPIIGAGTYARDGVCAVSCTGQGELFIRNVAAHEISARMRFLGESVATAAQHVVTEVLTPFGIGAGLVAMDAHGDIALPFNTLGMFRGSISVDGRMFIATHRDDAPAAGCAATEHGALDDAEEVRR